MEKEIENLKNNHDNFGAGFLVGTIFTLLAIFFLVTKKGRELVKNLEFPDFEIEDFAGFLSKEMSKITTPHEQATENTGHAVKSEIAEKEQLIYEKPSILGRRFFRRRRQ